MAKQPEPTIKYTINLPVKIYEKINKEAEKQDATMKEIIIQCIIKALGK